MLEEGRKAGRPEGSPPLILVYLQVNSRDGWDDLLETFGLPASTTNGSLSLKQTYLR